MTQPSMHPLVQPLGFLIGTWTGEGKGEYPSIESFTYGEEVRFWTVGRPWIGYSQRTWNLDSHAPMHSEMGFWRPQERRDRSGYRSRLRHRRGDGGNCGR